MVTLLILLIEPFHIVGICRDDENDFLVKLCKLSGKLLKVCSLVGLQMVICYPKSPDPCI